jgi:hypothetical protein
MNRALVKEEKRPMENAIDAGATTVYSRNLILSMAAHAYMDNTV